MSGLLFIRHAETDMAGRFCGHSNPSVNERGFEQIDALSKTISTEPVEALYSSDLQRAVTTADALATLFTVKAIKTQALREIDFGAWEGLSWQEIEKRDPAYFSRWMNSYPHIPAPGGEGFESFQLRVLDEVSQLVAAANNRWIAVVTHAGVMRVVLQSLCGLNEQSAWSRTQTYCCFFKYPIEARV
jgi:broad specificity phosphatase PhoE